MGMDYRFAGSASYPRFNDEVKAIVELFGGKMQTNRKPREECTMVEYFMEEPLKYTFPEGTPEVLSKWANDPYSDLTVKETQELYSVLKTKWKKVEKASDQIAEELSILHSGRMKWHIS